MEQKFKNKTERLAFETFCKNHIAHILKCGLLEHYDLVGFKLSEKDLGDVEMQMWSNHRYFSFNIEYNEEPTSRQWQEKQYQFIIKVLCHEITHIVTSEPDDLLMVDAHDNRKAHYFERATEQASRWLAKAYLEAYMPKNGINIKTGK